MLKARLTEAPVASLPANTVIGSGGNRYRIIDGADEGRKINVMNLKTKKIEPFFASAVVEVHLSAEEVANLVSAYVEKALSLYE